MIGERLALPFVLLLPAGATQSQLEHTETMKESESLHPRRRRHHC